jgi:predicted DNA-binding transcriptional regulator AlpA
MSLAVAFYSERDLVVMLGLSRTTLWRMVKTKIFPAPVMISRGRVGYPREAVDRWIAKKVASAGQAV